MFTLQSPLKSPKIPDGKHRSDALPGVGVGVLVGVAVGGTGVGVDVGVAVGVTVSVGVGSMGSVRPTSTTAIAETTGFSLPPFSVKRTLSSPSLTVTW